MGLPPHATPELPPSSPCTQTSVVDINEIEALAPSFITDKGLVSGELKRGQTDSEKLDHDSLA